MKRKGMRQRRKLVLLAVLLIMVGIAVWRIWQTPRPTVLHRHYQIVWEGVSAEAAESYLTALLDKGFTRLMGTAEDIASGVLLARGDLTLSISLSGGTLNMLMTRAEEPTATPLP